MSTHFNAFISYRHSPLDSQIAQRIHRQLERFKIPKAIQKATDIKKIDRIFRDKEELPLSVNLTDDINEALVHSDFLIIICTPRFQQSQWCMREIQLFLETHPIERILIVLAEGEPDDVVPPILTQGREPLCCDYRMTPRKAKSIELPRLVSAILGCRYDDLRQRQRQYRARRMTALASAAVAASLALSVYFYRTSQEIQANYEQSLRNQSKFLASEALQLLDDGDRLSAIALALEALPSEELQRPWVPEAEFALGRATNAYGSSASVQAVTAFTHKGLVKDFFTSPDGSYMVSWDDTNHIYVWEAETLTLFQTIDPQLDLTGAELIQASDNRLLLSNTDVLQCYDYLTGQLLWQYEASMEYTTSNILLAPDKQTLVMAGLDRLNILDAATGSIERVIPVPQSILDLTYTCGTLDAFSADGTLLALHYTAGYSDTGIIICSLESEQFLLADCTIPYLSSCCFTPSNNLVISSFSIDNMGSVSLMMGSATIIEPEEHTIICLDSATGSILWKESLLSYLPNYSSTLYATKYPDENGVYRDAICFNFSNICHIFDEQGGQELKHLELPSSIATFEPEENRLYWYLYDGQICSYSFGASYSVSFNYFPTGIVAGETNYGYYILPLSSSQIMLYASTRDSNYQTIATDTEMSYKQFTCSGHQYTVVGDSKGTIYCYNLTDHSLQWQFQMDSVRLYNASVMGFDQEETYFYLYLSRAFSDGAEIPAHVLRIDTQTGVSEEISLSFEIMEGYQSGTLKAVSVLWNDQIVYAAESSYFDIDKETGSVNTISGGQLMLLDPQSGAVQTLDLPISDVGRLIPDTANDRIAVCYSCDEGLLATLLQPATGDTVVLQKPMYAPLTGSAPVTAWSADSSHFAFRGIDNYVYLWDMEGNCTPIACENREPVSLCFDETGSMLMILFSNTELYCYRLDGTLLDRTEVYFYSGGLSYNDTITWTLTEDNIFVNAGGICSVIDRGSMAISCYVPECFCYIPESDRFYVQVSTSGGYQMAWYQRYSTEALIERGLTILGSNRLTQEQLEKYGLE